MFYTGLQAGNVQRRGFCFAQHLRMLSGLWRIAPAGFNASLIVWRWGFAAEVTRGKESLSILGRYHYR